MVTPSMAMTLNSKAEDQVIAIDSKSMLAMVMRALGTQEVPVFKEVACGQQGVKVLIKMDVTCAKYSVGDKINTPVVEGVGSPSREAAERSALVRAITLLNEEHLVRVKDYSSRVVHELDSDSQYRDVNAAIYSLEKMIAQYEATVEKTKSFAVQLEAKDAISYAMLTEIEKWDMYGSLKEYMGVLVQMFAGKVGTAKSKSGEIEFIRTKYHSKQVEKSQEALRKGYLQDVIVDAKVILDYVLEYLGQNRASYKNAPTLYGMVKGIVTFHIPPAPGIDYFGNIEMKAKSLRSEDAEQAAAFKALQYIERTYKIKIVDINYQERVDALSDHKLLLRILEQILTVASDVKESWGKLVESIKTELKAYSVDASTRYTGERVAKKIEAHAFCAAGLQELSTDATKMYESCVGRFEEMDQLVVKLNKMKSEAELI